MIAIPLSRKPGWRTLPWITISLILINVFIFAIFQRHDNTRWMDAEVYYYESGLARLEADLYKEHLDAEGRAIESDELPAHDAAENEKLAFYHSLINQSYDFIQQLDRGEVISEIDPRLAEWRYLRQSYDERLEEVVLVDFGFRPARPRPFTWLSTMFLHGNWGHLIGNMIFLWLVGSLIEYGCRHAVFPFIYLFGGMAATGFYWLMNTNSIVPVVGASGAIAGIMGAFTVLYGFRKVNIFLNLGFYFNYLKFPAILLLPLWMGKEVYQMLFNEASPVAYAAHLGGLGGGAVVALGVSRIPGMLDREAFYSDEEDQVGPLVEKALDHMGNLEYSEARMLLDEALVHAPDDAGIWRHIYVIDSSNPGSAVFHHTAGKLLNIYCRQPDTYGSACDLFREYVQIAKPAKLSAGLYMRVGNVLIQQGESDEAERILLKLVKKAPRLPGLPSALLKLSLSFKRQNRQEKWRNCLDLLKKKYPHTDETRIAMQQAD